MMPSVRTIGLSWHYSPGCAGFPLIPSGYRQEALIPESIADTGRVYIPPARGRCETDAS